MFFRFGSNRDLRDTADFLFELAFDAKKNFHKAKADGDTELAQVLSVIKAIALASAKRIQPELFSVQSALDQTHVPLLTIKHEKTHQALHTPKAQWELLNMLLDDQTKGGLAA